MKIFSRLAVLGALLAGLAIGAAVMFGSDSPKAAAVHVPSGLSVVSTWSGPAWKGSKQTVKLESGALDGGKSNGFVLVETAGQTPKFFTAPTATGAFRLIARTNTDWELRSSNGSLVIVNPSTPAGPSSPTFTLLGRALSPAHLGHISTTGVAVPVSYGDWSLKKQRYAQTAVVLVEQVKGYPGWKVDGYLPGYSMPRPLPYQSELQRPLVGPDGRAYTVDAKRGRLVLDTAWHSSTAPGRAPEYKLGTCRNWPGTSGALYQTCPGSITLDRGGSSTTLFRRTFSRQETQDWAWYFLQPSPDGKWLLLEDAMGACGTATWADFLPATGGQLRAAFPGQYVSEALGWLPDNTALIAAEADDSCSGAVSGIYQVAPEGAFADPNSPGFTQLVFPGNVRDATTWGFSR